MPKVVKPRRFPWKFTVTLLAWGVVAATAAYAGRQVQNFVLTDGHFALRGGITLEGVRFASKQRILQAFANDYGRSAFRTPMAERRRRLLAVDWVEEASISRLWPNRLLVRIKERTPAAFVNMANGQYLLIDSAGVFLSAPSRVKFNLPVLTGITEDQTEADRSARVGAASTLVSELGTEARKVSEINAQNLRDIRIVTQANGRAAELWMGDRNFLARFQNFNKHYPEILRTSPDASVFDLRLDDRITTK